ncbi:MAG: ATP-binding protein [Verrucomicrobiota bacterium]
MSTETSVPAVPPSIDATNSPEALESILWQLASPSAPSSTTRRFPARSQLDSGSRTEAQIRMDETRYRTLVELLPAITFMALFDEGIQEAYVSPQIEVILGYSQQEWLENPILWYERLHPEDKERWNVEFARTVASGEPFRAAYRFLARDGRVVWLHGEVRIARDELGQPKFLHGIGIDITKVKESEARVREYAERLERINQELEQFAYVASHDLQEPLRAIVSYSQVIAEEYHGRLDAEADRYFNQIVNAAKRMKNLIQALLDFSRIGHGNLPFAPIDIELCVHEAENNLQVAIRESGATIQRDRLPRITAIRTYMVILFQNLISNAIKYRSAAPPRIRISARRQKDGSWLFSVSDNGQGIDPKYWEKIFVIFQRLHTQQQKPGTGIGLSICKKIVELHGGRIWVESQPNSGSTFQFILPGKPQDPLAE